MKKNILGDIKGWVTAVGAALTAWLGSLAVPVYLLVVLGVTDYITGLVAAPYRGQQRNSAAGYRGIAKKVSMLVLVGVGAATDWLLAYTANTAGVSLTLGSPVGAAVAIWLVCNELVSILENIGDIGVRLPGFLKRLVQWVAQTTQQQLAPAEEEENHGTKTDSAV